MPTISPAIRELQQVRASLRWRARGPRDQSRRRHHAQLLPGATRYIARLEPTRRDAAVTTQIAAGAASRPDRAPGRRTDVRLHEGHYSTFDCRAPERSSGAVLGRDELLKPRPAEQTERAATSANGGTSDRRTSANSLPARLDAAPMRGGTLRSSAVPTFLYTAALERSAGVVFRIR